MRIERPDTAEYLPAFGTYIGKVPPLADEGILEFLRSQLDELVHLVGPLSEAEALVVHAPYTWTIKQVMGHITDCERIFGCRALRLARADVMALPPFDQDAFMLAANFNEWPIEELVAEFDLVRRSHLMMLGHLSPEALLRRGIVNHHPATCRAFTYIMAGHAKHHLDILTI